MNSMKIKKGDKVRVIAGKDKGKEGEVTRALPKLHRVVVKNVNVAKKSMRPTQQNPQGGIVSIDAPIQVSNVMLVCPSCGQPTRVGKREENGKRVRFCKKCNATID
ncbi:MULTISPECIES: 50S ribosomal protein L24 [Eggerthellaceae]|uniref:Large ribosomal subunit protein uL24 n=2 Tax=Xiamenia xianingshaonis TaxID=2682776 RepID=A0ABX0IMD5_9ACTN|nr:50S ribosomal protein L24 [Xiamenia xianingshaonis]NGM17239.1 50S ribosomal protein L24 [Eggerthellaceae bacterium zg-893]NHM14012.1 50S ribosomal protein L24 [Xiamenia xianingshaonis]NHM15876.1 50S ribosomal protein L24 [Xiamenia xianingshaonis]